MYAGTTKELFASIDFCDVIIGMSAAGSKEKEDIEEVDEEKRGAGKELCEFVKRPWYVLKRGVD